MSPIVHPDFPDLYLGREVEHDPASRRFVTRHADAPLRTRTHRRYGGPLDQQRLGACTGFAAAGAMNTAPLRFGGTPLYANRDGAIFYSENTQNDDYPGTWYFDRIDPNGQIVGHGQDTGSSGLAAAKTLFNRGLIGPYEHAFSLDQALRTLGQLPVITGVPWYEGMFTPDAEGFVSIGGQMAGGHEFEVAAVNVKERWVGCWNSWGPTWGRAGKFKLTWDTWGQLLSEDGDVTVLHPFSP